MKELYTTNFIVKQALVAAIYVVLTWALPFLAYGPIQFRLAEILTLLAFYDRRYVFGLTVACVIANFLSPFGLMDIFFGSLASLIALTLMSRTKNIFLASMIPAMTAPIIALVILLTSADKLAFFVLSAEIFISQIVVVTVLGLPLMHLLMKNERVRMFLLERDDRVGER